MNFAHRRRMPDGPESRLEAHVVRALPLFYDRWKPTSWLAGSVEVGAGLPDILVADWDPAVIAIADGSERTTNVLSYLKTVTTAKPATIAQRVKIGERAATREIEFLCERGVVLSGDRGFFLSPRWRKILPELIAIEVKVSNWKIAVAQANRNSMFSHKSYVALPEKLATRVASDVAVVRSRLGILAVDSSGEVRLIRRPRRTSPKIWSYYYKVARVLASEVECGRPI
jgi:hypothetical protein